MLSRFLDFIKWPNFQINYKSGRSVRLHFVSIRTDGGTIEWKSRSFRRPVYLNLDRVESIYRIRK